MLFLLAITICSLWGNSLEGWSTLSRNQWASAGSGWNLDQVWKQNRERLQLMTQQTAKKTSHSHFEGLHFPSYSLSCQNERNQINNNGNNNNQPVVLLRIVWIQYFLAVYWTVAVYKTQTKSSRQCRHTVDVLLNYISHIHWLILPFSNPSKPRQISPRWWLTTVKWSEYFDSETLTHCSLPGRRELKTRSSCLDWQNSLHILLVWRPTTEASSLYSKYARWFKCL